MRKKLEFLDATQPILGGVGALQELAAELGVSVQRLRQARLDHDKQSYRHPPIGWEKALVTVLRRRIRLYQKVIKGVGGS